jgi:AraC-like DNA-binding protein
VTGKPRSEALQQTGAAPAPGSPRTLPAPALLNEPYATAHDAVFTLVRLLLNRGIRAEQIAQHTGISPSLLDDPDGRVPLSGFNALWALTAQVLEHPGIALDLHERYPDNRMHFVAHLGMRCATMREAIEQWGKYALLVSESDSVRYETHGRTAYFIYQCLDPRFASHWFAEHYLALALFYARMFTGEPLRIERATFMHADPGGSLAADYQRAFGVPPEFGAAQNALIFDAALLDLPFRTADPYLRHFLVTQADELMARLEPEARMASRVVQALNLLLSKGQPLTLDEVAATLKLPVRRVRLLLESEGETFRELLNTVRREAAAHYLKQGLTVSQTAYLLGFSEPSALQHAFKRWYKRSAGQFQSEHAQLAAEDGRKVSVFGKLRHSS